MEIHKYIFKAKATILVVITVTGMSCKHGEVGRSIENTVYNYAYSLSKRVPDEFIASKTVKKSYGITGQKASGRIYHDPTLIVDESDPSNLRGKSGRGRAVAVFHIPNVIDVVAAAYLDAAEFKSYESEKNPDKLKHQIAFLGMWINPDLPDYKVEHTVVLIKGKHVVMYIKKDNTWKRGACEIDDMAVFGNAMAESAKGRKVEAEAVARYLDLARRLKATYIRK
jgi:hypothetical protein